MPEEVMTCRSPVIISTLENLIAPGGRLRLSPYIEATQLSKLFGELPSAESRNRSTQQILKKNTRNIQVYAKTFTDFIKTGKSFVSKNYKDKSFLDTYFLYYFPVNVAKTQQVLLDLIRFDDIPLSIHLLDIGCGVCTVPLAVIDFIIAWRTVCQLYGVPFDRGIQEIICIDKSSEVLGFAQDVLKIFAAALDERRKISSQGNMKFFADLLETINTTQFIRHDLEQQPIAGCEKSNLTVASYVFNELTGTGQSYLGSSIEKLQDNSIALLIEPGDQRKAPALMGWKNKLIKEHGFESLGLCAGNGWHEKNCQNCWNSRSQPFYEPLLYQQFRKECDLLIRDKRGFDELGNELLSWSNLFLKKRAISIDQKKANRCTWHDEISRPQTQVYPYFQRKEN